MRIAVVLAGLLIVLAVPLAAQKRDFPRRQKYDKEVWKHKRERAKEINEREREYHKHMREMERERWKADKEYYKQMREMERERDQRFREQEREYY
jgi:hypothetical protein